MPLTKHMWLLIYENLEVQALVPRPLYSALSRSVVFGSWSGTKSENLADVSDTSPKSVDRLGLGETCT